MTFSAWDHKLTARIRALGGQHMNCWNSVAAYSIGLYGVVALVFSSLGWLTAWWRLIIVVIIAYIAVLAVQVVLQRERPKFEQMGTYRMWWRTYSCPSGHATESAAVATAMLIFTHFPSPVIFLLAAGGSVALAIVVGFGRLIVGVHYLTDVLAGFALGIFIGVLYAQLF